MNHDLLQGILERATAESIGLAIESDDPKTLARELNDYIAQAPSFGGTVVRELENGLVMVKKKSEELE